MGTAVVPAQTRHPLLLAQQVATITAVQGPFTLGLGLGHRALLDQQYGEGGPRRVDWLREYLPSSKHSCAVTTSTHSASTSR